MSSNAVASVTKMMESLPEREQDHVVEHVRGCIAEVWDEAQWEATFGETQKQLVVAARRAKEEIAAGHSAPMDYGRL